MSSGSSNSSILNMPDYGQGLSEALQAQTDALSGTLTGTPLQETVERYERPLRMSAAQIDNDVLRQTLLGGQVPVYKSVTQDNLLERRIAQPGEGGQVTQIDYGGAVTKDGKVVVGDGDVPQYIRDLQETKARHGSDPTAFYNALMEWEKTAKIDDIVGSDIASKMPESAIYKGSMDTLSGKYNDDPGRGIITAAILELNRYGSTTFLDSFLSSFGTPEPIYKKNDDGSDFVVPKDEGGNFILEATNETEIPQGGVAATPGELTGYTRAGTGLVDMMGDTRNVQEFTTRQATEEDVAAGLASEVGESITEATGNRQAGFDAEDNFLGLSALAEDIQRGNLSRQREADLSDVERLSGRYSDVMDQFRPGTQQALTDASAVLDAQKENLTGAGAITVPGGSTYSDSLTAGTMKAAQVGAAPTLSAGTSYTAEQLTDPMALTAATSYDPSASVTGDGYTATAGLQGGNIGADSLRAAL